MQEIITILIMAMNLLTAVQGNPNLPPQFKETAISVANNAIVFANQELAKLPADQTPVQQAVTPVVVPVAPVQTPVVGGIITPMDKSSLTFELRNTTPKSPIEPLGAWNYGVFATDSDGKTVLKDSVEIKIKLNGEVIKTVKGEFDNEDGHVKFKNLRYFKNFYFVPEQTGEYTFEATSRGLTKTINLVVN